METFRQFAKEFRSKIDKALENGNVFKAGEIEANITTGSIIVFILTLLVVGLVLNELRVFTTNIWGMRIGTLITLAIEIPILAINQKYHGDKKWLREALSWGLIAICAVLSIVLGHNVTLLMVMPVVVSIRYCSPTFTKKVFFWSVVDFTIATVGNAFFGVVNLNVYNPAKGTELTIEGTLRQAIETIGYDRVTYLKQLILNEYLPKLMIFIVIGYTCVLISFKGKEMIKTQADISGKATRISTELGLATKIQADMLPCIFPAFPTHDELDIYAKNVPAKEMGGDFYDFFKIDDDHIALVMADVSGKGIGAALFMTIAKTVVKNQLMLAKSPSLALENANNQLCENNHVELFVTAWAGIYEVSSGKLTYANAGHNYPVIYRKDGSCEYLKSHRSLVLAAFENTKYTDEELVLNHGDEIFLYTDGVTEATNIREELFGDSRFLDFMNSNISGEVKTQVDSLFEELNRFEDGAEQFDDITMLGMKIK